MARESDRFETWKRPPRDGMLRCALCIEAGPDSDPDWCPAAQSLVCNDCCVALLHGDVMRLISITASAGRMITPDALFSTCTECERAHRHATEHLLADETDTEDTPLC